MKFSDPKMATPIEESIEQNLKVCHIICDDNNNNIKREILFLCISKVRSGLVNLSDGKSNPEVARLKLTMELLILQRIDTSTPSTETSIKLEVLI